MANKKISDFTAVTSVASGDLIEIETAGGNSRKVTKANFGVGRSVNLGTMRPLTDFTQISISGTRSIVETSGKAITIIESAPIATLRMIGIRRAVPSTTSRVAVFVQPNFHNKNFNGIQYGWSDGTKYHMITLHASQVAEIQTWTDLNTRATTANVTDISALSIAGTGFWLGLRLDNTAGKAYWEVSADGVNFSTHYIITVSGAYLTNMAGYSNAFVGMFSYASGFTSGSTEYPCALSILDWDESGLSRSFG